jgi:hypothetical protein
MQELEAVALNMSQNTLLNIDLQASWGLASGLSSRVAKHYAAPGLADSLSLSLSLSLTHTHTHSLSLSLSLSHTHTLTHSLTHTQTHSLTHSLTFSLLRPPLSPSLSRLSPVVYENCVCM